jgi:hypothetical protein
MLTMEALIALIGRPIQSPDVRAFLDTLPLQATIEEDELEEGVEPIHWLSNQDDGYLIRHSLMAASRWYSFTWCRRRGTARSPVSWSRGYLPGMDA